MRLVELTSPALEALLARQPVAQGPVGATEPHGPQCCGAPAEATAAEGEETFATLTRLLVELVREEA